MDTTDTIFGIMASLGKDEYTYSDLKYLTSPFEISDSSLRTNLHRMNKKNLLIIRKENKLAYYSFGEKGKIIGKNVGLGFKNPNWKDWNNQWIAVVFSVPDSEKSLRYKIRKKLEAYRFAPLYPAFWIKPLHKKENIERNFKSLIENKFCTIIRFEYLKEITNKTLNEIWELDEKNNEFVKAINLLEKESKKINTKNPEIAFTKRYKIGNQIIPILSKDPLLPKEFLPSNWMGQKLRKEFLEWDKKVYKVSKPFWEKIFKEN